MTVITQTPAPYRSYPQVAALKAMWTATIASEQLLATGCKYLLGWSIYETTGSAPASLVLWDLASAATGVGGLELNYGQINLTSNQSIRDFFPSNAIENQTGGLYLQVLSGSVAGTVFYTA